MSTGLENTLPAKADPPPNRWLIALRCGHWLTISGDPKSQEFGATYYCEPCERPEPIGHSVDIDHDCLESWL